MATQADVRRIALSLPAAEEKPGRFAFAVKDRQGKLKEFVWVWMERVDPKKARVPQPKVVAIQVANLNEREILLRLDTNRFFTEPHYAGYPAILVRLAEITARELRPLITEAWRCRAPEDAKRTKKRIRGK
jgi:hypothetical protein